MNRIALAAPLTLAAILAMPACAVTDAREPRAAQPGAPISAAERDVGLYLAAIAGHDTGPDGLNAVIALNPNARIEAREAEAAGLPLAGRAILVKDNIETRELPTTAGSLALKDNRTGRDATLIANIRRQGGVILGKANMSEWANIRESNSTTGWSAIGGLARNPHATDRDPCGSSTGSAIAVAAKFAWAAIGTETNGSITCPASANGVVGFKPTVGLVSRKHIVPISLVQDTAGPMARSVSDAALLLNAMAGSDPADPATSGADAHVRDFTAALGSSSLKDVRIGVMKNQVGTHPGVTAVFNQARSDMEAAGAVLVDIEYTWPDGFGRQAIEAALYELRRGMSVYLASLPLPNSGFPANLADIVAFNEANAETEMKWFGQNLFEWSLSLTDEDQYRRNRTAVDLAAGKDGIDRLLAENKVEFLIAPTAGPAWAIDLVNGDNPTDHSIGAGSLPARAGYPHLTVPMGAVEGLPVGLSIFAGKWQDHAVLKAGAAYERARTASVPQPSFKRWSPN